MCLHLPLVLLLLFCCLITSLPLLFSCPPGCCCPRPGVLILCESLGLHVLPRSVPLTTSALSVARNHLCNIDNVLRRYSSLQELSLGHNRLERFPRGLPASLESLQLQENRITFITAGDLRNLRNLTRLDLEDNRIRAIQPGALLSLMRLRMLSLKGNQLSSLPSHLPGSLMHLDVSANCISTLDLPSLAVLVNLQVLKINSNCLRSVPEHAFDGLTRLHSLELANNLWVCECNIMYLYRWLLMDRLRMATDLVCTAPLHLAHKLLLTLSVVAICPKILMPSEKLVSFNTSKVMLGNSSKESPNPTSDTNRNVRTSCRTSLVNLNAKLPSSVNHTVSRSHQESNQSSLDGLSYEQCLLLNATYLVPQTTQTPHIPTPGEDPGCRNNTNSIQKGFLSTSVPIFFTSEAGVQVEATPRTLTQTSDPALVSLLSVLCVLTGLLLVIVILVLRSLLWRIQSVAPLQSTVSSQRNS
ncbi:hypothetical protein Q7C36_010652 [Tachysurus vachellii]|uniref:LRRCT domain-containing protein n=1 Tax=Tachysurus vachellii TaxID=175792 RepID=A0AA88N196_TACVA|nr:hypothetical protein Q7C36_010652 [Tachysurus vachellii]